MQVLNRRSFIRSTLALAVLAALPSAASQLVQYQQAYLRNRRAGTRPELQFKQRWQVSEHGVPPSHQPNAPLQTAALQRLIDQLAAAGGGALVFGAGFYATAPLQLKSGVYLQLDAGAVLQGSVDITDYYDSEGQLRALVWAEQASNIGVIGQGDIDGRGRALVNNINDLHHSGARVEADFNYWRNRSNHRPSVIAFYHCQQVRMYDCTLRNSAAWVQHYGACIDLVIDNQVVDSDCYWNNDGIDINDCQQVRVTGCFINAADDAICLKSTKGSFNQNVYIADCVLRSSANGLKFGTESQGGFLNVTVRNLQVFDTYRAAVALETVDGARLEQVDIDGVVARHVGCALFLRLGQRNMQVEPAKAPGTLSQVRIRNLDATIAFDRADVDYQMRGPGLNSFFNPIPASIVGLPDAKIRDVTLEHIRIRYPGRANTGIAYRPYTQLHLVPQERAAYPEYSMFGELPAYGLFVRHVAGLTLRNIQFELADSDFRPALVLDDVTALRLESLHLAGSQRPQLVLQDCQTVAGPTKWLSHDRQQQWVALAADGVVRQTASQPYVDSYEQRGQQTLQIHSQPIASKEIRP